MCKLEIFYTASFINKLSKREKNNLRSEAENWMSILVLKIYTEKLQLSWIKIFFYLRINHYVYMMLITWCGRKHFTLTLSFWRHTIKIVFITLSFVSLYAHWLTSCSFPFLDTKHLYKSPCQSVKLYSLNIESTN